MSGDLDQSPEKARLAEDINGGGNEPVRRLEKLPSKKKAPTPFIKKDDESPKKAEDEKSHRLLEILARRRGDTRPAFVGDTPPPAPLPSNAEISDYKARFIEKAETLTGTILGKLRSLFPRGKWGAHHPNSIRSRLIERGGLRRFLAHPFFNSFYPEAKEEWTWKHFLRTRGFERICFIALLILASCAFYTWGGRQSVIKQHETLIAYGRNSNTEQGLEDFREALRLKKSGQLSSAYDKFLRLSNENGIGLHGVDRQLGEILISLNQPKEAQNYLENAIRRNDGASDAHAILGSITSSFPDQILSLVPSDQLAENHFHKAVEEDPGNANAYILWGISLQNRGNYEQALKKFEIAKAVEESGTNATLRDIYISLCNEKLKTPADAQAANTAGGLFASAFHNFAQNTPQQGVEDLRKAQQLVSPDIYATVTKGPFFQEFLNAPEVKELFNAPTSQATAQQNQVPNQ